MPLMAHGKTTAKNFAYSSGKPMSRLPCPSYAIGIIRSGSRPPRDPTSGEIEVAFVSAPEAGPSVQAQYVRVTAIQGSWTLVPTRGGGSLVTYVVASDPGGTLRLADQ